MTAIAERRLTGEEQIEALTQLNAIDLITAFKLDRPPVRRAALALARVPARRFSRQVVQLDRLIGDEGLAAGGRYILELFARSLTITGAEHVPASGPLLVVCNHPGMVDVMALWVGLERRDDIRIIAAERPLLRAVPSVCRYLLFVSEQSGARTGLLRQAAGHMRAGGALVTFPAGHIEPDPTVRPGALESLAQWSTSVALFMRLVPEALVLPAAVGGVISASAQRNPAVGLLGTQRERDWAAATLQVLMPAYRDTHTRVAFGPPVAAAELAALEDPAAITRAVTDRVAVLLRGLGAA